MKKRIISFIAALAVTVSAIPVSFAENDENIQEEFSEAVTYEETYDEAESTEDSEIELYSDDIQLFAAYTPRTSSPNGVSYYYSGNNPFYSAGFVGECTWYAWGRAYEILGSRPSLPTNGAGRWFNSCNSYPKSTNYWAAKVGAIACYSNHVAVVEAVGSNGAPSAISEGGYQSSSTYGQIVQPINERSNRYFHYGKDYTSGFQGYIYILNNADSGTGAGGSAHTHSWSTHTESGHPHRQYRTCSCGAKEYTGGTQRVGSCTSCYPLGYASLTREHDRIAKTATFYRNNVSNANSYEVILRKDGSYYDSFSMNSTSRTVSNLRAGTYTATLTVKNTNTGQTKTSTCSSFTIVDSYPVRYNANGGTLANVPSQQLKIKDENLAITSSEPRKEHYVFKGWASSKTATEPQYKSGEYYTKNTSITLYAVWEPEIYTINFDPNGGNGETVSTKITYGNKMKMPNDIARPEYYLKGWSKDMNSQTAEYRIGVDYGFDRNTPLYAVWGQSTWGNEVAICFAGGDGTKENPYQISNAAELAYLAKTVNEQSSTPEYTYYILTDNIGLGYDEWTPIGLYDYENQYFHGSFDGNGYTISDLKILQINAGNIGLFGYAKDSEIKNLTLLGEVTNITSTDAVSIGELVGFAENTNITECSVKYVNISNITASDTDYSNIGCIAGKTSGGEIKSCMADESNIIVKSGSFNMGIICGKSSSDITDCSVNSTAELFETTGSGVENIYMGGLCGQQTRNIEKCTVNAGRLSSKDISVTGTAYVGGLVGKVFGKVNLCTAKFTSDTQKQIDGENYPVSISVNSKSTSFIGGIAGYSEIGAKINNCTYNGKSISSDSTRSSSHVGGLTGYSRAKTPKTVNAQGSQSLSRSLLPKRDGYVATWYTDSDLKNEYDFSQPVTTDMTLYAKWTEGKTDTPIWDGTSSEPAYNADTKTYTVTNGQELAWVSDVTNGIITSGTNFPESTSFEGYTIELANDIYLNDIRNVSNWETTPPKNQWRPIGKDNTNSFLGIFDGKGYCINGIYIYQNTSKPCGLFGYSKGTIENISMSIGYIYGKDDVGTIAGVSSLIKHCSNDNVLLVGNGTYVGGITGRGTEVYYCNNNAKISNTGSQSGGIAGEIISNGTISYCYNEGQINSGGYVGGIVGLLFRGTAEYCYNAGSVRGAGESGGIAGSIVGAEISYCYNTSTVTSDLSSSYTAYAGGIAGEGDGTISNCYNQANVNSNVSGGIIGQLSYGTVSYCYSTGVASGTQNYTTGGIVGDTPNWLTSDTTYTSYIKYSYSIQSPAYNTSGPSTLHSITSVTQKSSSAMKILSNLTGFSTSNWAVDSSINIGYPYLKSLEDTYKTYKVTVIEDVNDSAAINRSFVNVDGVLFSNTKNDSASVGGIMGGSGGNGNGAKSDAKNLLSVVNKISSKTSSNVNTAYAGDIIGYNDNSFNFSSVYTNSNLDLSAENTTTASNIKTDTIATPWSDAQLKRASNLNRVFGPDTYQSLEHLKEHPEAVWVIKDGELPELYYNVLRDITLDKVENGTISVDKTQAVDGERVIVTATPAENYQLNKIYVNGEIAGDTFVVNGDSKVYATFTEKTPTYKATVKANNNAVASLMDVDSTSEVSLMSADDTISAEDGNEIKVNTEANDDYAVEAVYVNGEELASDSFIITEDSVVTLDTVNISTEIKAITNDAESIGNYFALLSGSVEDVDDAERYIRYWVADNPDEVYTTEVQEGGGDYSVFVEDLVPETTYQYQMCEGGEIKSFTTLYSMVADSDGIGDNPIDPVDPTPSPVIPTPNPVEPRAICFEVQNAQIADDKVAADIVNISDKVQSGSLIFAAYTDDDILVTAESKNIDAITPDTLLPCEFDVPDGTSRYKIFVWNSVKGMVPLSESVEIK